MIKTKTCKDALNQIQNQSRCIAYLRLELTIYFFLYDIKTIHDYDNQ